jgi:hypothetical protein
MRFIGHSQPNIPIVGIPESNEKSEVLTTYFTKQWLKMMKYSKRYEHQDSIIPQLDSTNGDPPQGIFHISVKNHKIILIDAEVYLI